MESDPADVELTGKFQTDVAFWNGPMSRFGTMKYESQSERERRSVDFFIGFSLGGRKIEAKKKMRKKKKGKKKVQMNQASRA